MAESKKIDMEFSWGDSARISEVENNKYLGLSIGSVCGVRKLRTTKDEERFGAPIGSNLYLIEGADGTSLVVPEQHLEKILEGQ